MKKIIVVLGVLVFMGCSSPKPRRPLNTPKNTFLKNSAARNKARFAQEKKLFEIKAAQETALDFIISEKGFWYALIGPSVKQKKLPKPGDQVTITYRIEDLNKNILYDEETLGKVSFLVDKEDVIPALREGVKVLQPGQKGVFLFPSFMCFGVQGDFEKIGSRQPLRFIITLVALKSEK